MENKILYAFKTMPEFHKGNLESYLIYQGIYTVSPSISDEEAEFIYNICFKTGNENVNPFTISHYITDEYTKGNISKEELENLDGFDISSAAFYDDLNYLSPISEKESNEEIEKN